MTDAVGLWSGPGCSLVGDLHPTAMPSASDFRDDAKGETLNQAGIEKGQGEDWMQWEGGTAHIKGAGLYGP